MKNMDDLLFSGETIEELQEKMNLLSLPTASLTPEHIEHLKAQCVDTLKLLRPIILSDISTKNTNWALQQKSYVVESIETLLDFKQKLKEKEREEIELIRYQNDTSRKVMQDLHSLPLILH